MDWIEGISESVESFLRKLEAGGRTGDFLPCPEGVTEHGRKVKLGFSCFALKIYYTLGLWDDLSEPKQDEWIDFIQSYQLDGVPEDGELKNWEPAQNCFYDPYVTGELCNLNRKIAHVVDPIVSWSLLETPIDQCQDSLHRLGSYFSEDILTKAQRITIAETKQAIATLDQVGARPRRSYGGFPRSPDAVRTHLDNLNWRKPWGAGGQASGLAVLLATQATDVCSEDRTEDLLGECRRFFDEIVDTDTGAYFRGGTPSDPGQLINGAMKVLSGMEWLDQPIHYPEKLIDTALSTYEDLLQSGGCHVVDLVYVLHRCQQQIDYRRNDIEDCTEDCLAEIRKYYHPNDGGFSQQINEAQDAYYGVPISRGLNESDVQGTCLFCWTLSMIEDMNADVDLGWKVITP